MSVDNDIGVVKFKPSNHHEGSVKYEGLDGETVHISQPEDAQQPPSPEKKPISFTVDEAVELLGFGRFQIKLSFLTGLAWMADAMEMTLLAIISPTLQCEWNISSMEQAMITTVVFSGMMLSSTFWALMTFSMGALSALAPNYYCLLVLRGLTGFGIGGAPQSVTLYAEFLPTAQRAKCVVLIEAFWAIGAAFEAVLAFLWLPESARYQIASGHVDLAYKTLAKVAYENRRILPPGELIDKSSIEGAAQRGNVISLFVRELRVTTLLLWYANSFSYYGLVLFTTVLFQSNDNCHGGGDFNSTFIGECRQLIQDDYFDLLSTTLAEFPGLILTAITIEWFGRKVTMGIEFGVFAIFTFLLLFCLSRSRRTVTTFIFIARAFISGAFQCAYVYTPEIYPTTLRAVGLGASSAMARFGAIATPFIAQVCERCK
uniref:Major facilitator superfamily (MFS) profile domain-containing protein n=1 Tax=Parascaris univalens TaxID=6257 RepID=A0A915ALZ4_PARUN